MSGKLCNIERTEELSRYEKWLQDLSNKNSSTVVFNDGKEHAAILFNTMFNAAKKQIRLYCDNMSPDVSETNEYYSALKSCKDRGVEVKILLNTSDKTILNNIIFSLLDKENDVKFISMCRKEDDNKQTLNNFGMHFAVVDESIYRMEYDTKNFKAIASFNDPEMCANLIRLFDNTWNVA